MGVSVSCEANMLSSHRQDDKLLHISNIFHPIPCWLLPFPAKLFRKCGLNEELKTLRYHISSIQISSIFYCSTAWITFPKVRVRTELRSSSSGRPRCEHVCHLGQRHISKSCASLTFSSACCIILDTSVSTQSKTECRSWGGPGGAGERRKAR